MRRLPLIAALLAWPATPGDEGQVASASAAAPPDGEDSIPRDGLMRMDSPAFGFAASGRTASRLEPAAGQVPLHAGYSDPAHRRPVARAIVPSPAASPAGGGVVEAPIAVQPPQAGSFPVSYSGGEDVARFQPAVLLQSSTLLDRSVSDAASVAIAPELASALAPQAQIAPDGQAPVLPYDTRGFDAAQPVAIAPAAPVLAYDTSGFSGVSTETGAEEDRAESRPTPPTIAYPESGSEKSVFEGDFLIVAAGAVALPSYEGSDDTSVIPAAAVAGNFKGIGINPRAGGLALDIVPDAPGAKVGLSLGPVVRMRANRTGKIGDPVVARLGKLDTVFEAGLAAGLTIRRVLNPHDRLSLGADMRFDISGRGSGYVIAPSMSYLTPLSRAMVAGVLASAEFADGRYAHYNYDVSQAGAVTSGLPAYSAHGGLKSVSYGLFVARDLNANLLDGGLSIGVGGMYGHLYGSAAETPITAIRGSASQWSFGAGLGYVF